MADYRYTTTDGRTFNYVPAAGEAPISSNQVVTFAESLGLDGVAVATGPSEVTSGQVGDDE
jgi:hypothetical protein